MFLQPANGPLTLQLSRQTLRSLQPWGVEWLLRSLLKWRPRQQPMKQGMLLESSWMLPQLLQRLLLLGSKRSTHQAASWDTATHWRRAMIPLTKSCGFMHLRESWTRPSLLTSRSQMLPIRVSSPHGSCAGVLARQRNTQRALPHGRRQGLRHQLLRTPIWLSYLQSQIRRRRTPRKPLLTSAPCAAHAMTHPQASAGTRCNCCGAVLAAVVGSVFAASLLSRL
mmetsp:Transcript_82054/g.142653  ORF Transcript_82054/g.142653 Transcript_82054/m.142653 type:complete len:224 (-) Transcript_82054:136-807(-)